MFENWAKKGDFPNQPEPHQCDRVCKQGEKMECRYTFVLELHTSMGKVSIAKIHLNFVIENNNVLIQTDLFLNIFAKFIDIAVLRLSNGRCRLF